MLLQFLLLGISVKLLSDEMWRVNKKQELLFKDCVAVQASGRALSMQMLNFWTVVTVASSVLYMGGVVIIGAVPIKAMYQIAFYQLFTIFMDYSFMSGLRDCDNADTIRWRIDACLRCGFYMWVVVFVLGKITQIIT